MYNETNTNFIPRARGANEISMQVRETERKMALLHVLSHSQPQESEGGIVRRTARRIATLMANLF